MRAASVASLSLFTILIAVEALATGLIGRADPFRPLIAPRRELPMVPPSLRTVEAPIERPVLPELVGIIADPDGAIAALRLNQKVELLRQGERKGSISVLSVQPDRVILSIQGRRSELTVDRRTR